MIYVEEIKLGDVRENAKPRRFKTEEESQTVSAFDSQVDVHYGFLQAESATID